MSEEQVFEFTLKTVHMNSAEINKKTGTGKQAERYSSLLTDEVLRRNVRSMFLW